MRWLALRAFWARAPTRQILASRTSIPAWKGREGISHYKRCACAWPVLPWRAGDDSARAVNGFRSRAMLRGCVAETRASAPKITVDFGGGPCFCRAIGSSGIFHYERLQRPVELGAPSLGPSVGPLGVRIWPLGLLLGQVAKPRGCPLLAPSHPRVATPKPGGTRSIGPWPGRPISVMEIAHGASKASPIHCL